MPARKLQRMVPTNAWIAIAAIVLLAGCTTSPTVEETPLPEEHEITGMPEMEILTGELTATAGECDQGLDFEAFGQAERTPINTSLAGNIYKGPDVADGVFSFRGLCAYWFSGDELVEGPSLDGRVPQDATSVVVRGDGQVGIEWIMRIAV